MIVLILWLVLIFLPGVLLHLGNMILTGIYHQIATLLDPAQLQVII